jgi:hypothetical protein
LTEGINVPLVGDLSPPGLRILRVVFLDDIPQILHLLHTSLHQFPVRREEIIRDEDGRTLNSDLLFILSNHLSAGQIFF